MNTKLGACAAGLVILAFAGSAQACEQARMVAPVETSLEVSRVVDRVRAEQRAQIVQAARRALAQLRSETATALARGATSGDAGGVKAAP